MESVIASYIDTNVSSHEGKKATLQFRVQVGQRRNTYQYSKWESRFCLGLDAAKNTQRIKKALNKGYLKLNFVQKSPQALMSISLQSGAMGLERYTFLKNNNVQKQGSRFSLGRVTAKNTHCIKKSFK